MINLECRAGRFGQNCRHYCSRLCAIQRKCDRVTGHCIGGCQAGWKKAHCDQSKILEIFIPNLATILICKTSEIYQIHEYVPTECDGKMFGKDCTESCGKCLNNENCHHVNGNCVNGCDPGYYGINCTNGTDNLSQRLIFSVLPLFI